MNQDSFFQVEMGQRVSMYPLSRYTAAEGRKDLITLLHNNPYVAKLSYHEDLGSFFYIPECNKYGLDPRVYYAFLAVQWPTDQNGKMLAVDKFQIILLRLGNDYYQNLADKFEINGDLTKLNIQVRCSDAKYQKLSFEVAGGSPMYQNQNLYNSVMSKAKEMQQFIPKVLGREVTSKLMAEKLSDVSESDFTSQQAPPQMNAVQLGNGGTFGVLEQPAANQLKQAPVETLQQAPVETREFPDFSKPPAQAPEPVQEVKTEPVQEAKTEPVQEAPAFNSNPMESASEAKKEEGGFGGFEDFGNFGNFGS
jgi:hypothetical protein